MRMTIRFFFWAKKEMEGELSTFDGLCLSLLPTTLIKDRNTKSCPTPWLVLAY